MNDHSWMNLPENTLQEILKHILLSEAAGPNIVTQSVSVGINALSDFWGRHYLEEYIPHGGSKIKFVTGRAGSGKTHLLDLLRYRARQLNYITVAVSAREFMLHDFREVYLEILRHIQLDQLFESCAERILHELIPNADQRPAGMSIADFLVSQRQLDVITRGEMRDLLRKYFLNNPALDNNFGLCCSLLVGDYLGLATCDPDARDILLRWIHGDKTLKVTTLRAMGMAAYGITKYNARHMLRSLCYLTQFGGLPGILVTVDHLETMLNLSGLDEMKYTPARRVSTYENLRQLIDDIDSMKNIMFVFAFNRELMDNEKIGLPSYSALWMRIQNEIISPRFNAFTDIANLDKLAEQEYTPDMLVEITRRVAELTPELLARVPEVSAEALWRRNGLGALIPETAPSVWPRVISRDEAEKLIRKYVTYGSVGLVRQALRLSLGLLNPAELEAESEEEEEDIYRTEEEERAEAERIAKEMAAAKYHVIRSGDTLSGLAVKYHTSVNAICKLNGISPSSTLKIGKKIRVR